MKASLILLILAFCINATGQNLIGYKEQDIRKYMKDNNQNMTFRSFINNSTFKYLKYGNRDDSETLLFFLASDSVCRSVRLICDKSLKAEKLKELDSSYKKNGENIWTETKNANKYIIELKDEDYTFIITIKPNK